MNKGDAIMHPIDNRGDKRKLDDKLYLRNKLFLYEFQCIGKVHLKLKFMV